MRWARNKEEKFIFIFLMIGALFVLEETISALIDIYVLDSFFLIEPFEKSIAGAIMMLGWFILSFFDYRRTKNKEMLVVLYGSLVMFVSFMTTVLETPLINYSNDGNVFKMVYIFPGLYYMDIYLSEDWIRRDFLAFYPNLTFYLIVLIVSLVVVFRIRKNKDDEEDSNKFEGSVK